MTPEEEARMLRIVENAANAPLPWIPMFQDGEEPPPQEWAILDRIPIREVCLYSGEGAAGKSITGLHLCAAHALGQEWLGMTPTPGPAIFIDAEDDIDVIHRRLDAVRRYYNTTFAAMENGGLHLMSLRDHETLLATTTPNRPLMPTPLYSQLIDAADNIKPKMIVIASLANVYGGVEFDRSQVQQFVGMLTRIAIRANGSLILISHPSLTGINSNSGISGSTQWHNAVRARMYLQTIKSEADDDPDKQTNSDLRSLEFRKNQYGPLSSSLTLRWKDGLFLPEIQTAADFARKQATADDVFLKLMHLYATSLTKVAASPKARSYGPTAFANEAEARNNRVSKHDLEEAMKRGLDSGKFHIVEEGPPSRRFAFVKLARRGSQTPSQTPS